MVPTYAPGSAADDGRGAGIRSVRPVFRGLRCARLVVGLTFLCAGPARQPGRDRLLGALLRRAPVRLCLFQSLWPMSDIPGGRALDRRRAVPPSAPAAGTQWRRAPGPRAGFLVRPNLPILAARSSRALVASPRGASRERWIRVALFGAAAVPAARRDRRAERSWNGVTLALGYGADIFSIGEHPCQLWPVSGLALAIAVAADSVRARSDSCRAFAATRRARSVSPVCRDSSRRPFVLTSVYSTSRIGGSPLSSARDSSVAGLAHGARTWPSAAGCRVRWGHVAVAFVMLPARLYDAVQPARECSVR